MDYPRTSDCPDMGGKLISLTFHSYLICDDYQSTSFTSAKNGPYFNCQWGQSPNMISFGCQQRSSYSLIDIYSHVQLTDESTCKEMAEHITYHLANFSDRIKKIHLHLPKVINKTIIIKSLETIGVNPYQHKCGYFPICWVCQKQIVWLLSGIITDCLL